MNTIEIIGIIIGAVATVLAGVHFIVKHLIGTGVNKQRLHELESKVSGYENKFIQISGIEHNINTIDGKFEHKFTTVNTRLGNIENNVDNIGKDVVELKTDISFIRGIFEATLGKKDSMTKKKSPLSLTDEGEDVRTSNNLDEMIDANWDKINAILYGMKTRNPYDIQQFCIEKTFIDMDKFFSEKDVEKLKMLSYTSSIPLMSITRLLSVLIRDRFFKENDIDTGEVDNHDPDLQKK
jgi:hypothetical protein